VKFILDDSSEDCSESKDEPKSLYSDTAPRGDYKMVLVVRNDLKMGKGKIGAQCGKQSKKTLFIFHFVTFLLISQAMQV
jgi:hypothetical protein